MNQVITAAQFEQARLAFVNAWLAVEQDQDAGVLPVIGGARTTAGLTAALNYLRIKVDPDG